MNVIYIDDEFIIGETNTIEDVKFSIMNKYTTRYIVTLQLYLGCAIKCNII